jgi:hypothetical protein
MRFGYHTGSSSHPHSLTRYQQRSCVCVLEDDDHKTQDTVFYVERRKRACQAVCVSKKNKRQQSVQMRNTQRHASAIVDFYGAMVLRTGSRAFVGSYVCYSFHHGEQHAGSFLKSGTRSLYLKKNEVSNILVMLTEKMLNRKSRFRLVSVSRRGWHRISRTSPTGIYQLQLV